MAENCSQKRYQAVGFPCNRMLKLSSSRGIRIDIPVLSVSWSFEDHSVNIKALRKGLIEHEASDTGGVPRWQSSCLDRLAEATVPNTWAGEVVSRGLLTEAKGCEAVHDSHLSNEVQTEQHVQANGAEVIISLTAP